MKPLKCQDNETRICNLNACGGSGKTINQNFDEGRMKNYNKIISLVIPQRYGIKIKSSARNDDEWLAWSDGRLVGR